MTNEQAFAAFLDGSEIMAVDRYHSYDLISAIAVHFGYTYDQIDAMIIIDYPAED